MDAGLTKSNPLLGPLRFNPVYKSVIWGGEFISRYKGVDIKEESVGESWEISSVPNFETVVSCGELAGLTLKELIARYGADLLGKRLMEACAGEFPLLIKFIDAHHDLSLQVHPDESMARRLHNCSGKTEMWYVIESEPGASIISGFARTIDHEECVRRVADGTIIDTVAVHPTRPGDAFFIPPGRIHAIGAGNFLLEVQQSSDITYRIYDYGRPRELHLANASAALDYNARDNYRITPQPQPDGSQLLVECPEFMVCSIEIAGEYELPLPDDSFLTLTCVKGEVVLHTEGFAPERLKRGETILIPAAVNAATLTGQGLVVSASC